MKVVNPAQPVPIERYDRAIACYLEQIDSLNEIVGIIQTGSVKAPGLSDIDLIVVTKENFSRKQSDLLDVKGIDDDLFIHGPLIIPESMLPDLPFLVYTEPLKVIKGTPTIQNLNALDPTASRTLALCYVIDFTESRLFQFSTAQRTTYLDQRSWMTRIWSATHTWNLLQEIIRDLPQPEAIHLIRTAREDWQRDGWIPDSQFLEVFHATRQLNHFFFKTALSLYKQSSSEAKHPPRLFAGDRVIRFWQECEDSIYYTKHYSLFNRELIYCHATHPCSYPLHLAGYGLNGLEVNESDAPWHRHYETMKKRASVVKAHWAWREAHVPKARSLSGYLGFVCRERSWRQRAMDLLHTGRINPSCTF